LVGLAVQIFFEKLVQLFDSVLVEITIVLAAARVELVQLE